MDRHKLKYEALLSEKLLLKKNQLKDSSAVRKLGSSVLLLTRQLSISTKELANVHGTNLKLKTKNKKLLDTLNEAIKTTNVLKFRYASAKDSLSKLAVTNRILGDSIRWLANISTHYKEELENAITRSMDQPLISCLKGNNDLTVRARKTKHIIARVELPGHLSNLNFRIEGEDKNFFDGKSTIISKVIDKKKQAMASISDQPTEGFGSQIVEIIYSPVNRLRPGIYTLQIFNDSTYIGSFKTKLN
jgi:hypothetical protein